MISTNREIRVHQVKQDICIYLAVSLLDSEMVLRANAFFGHKNFFQDAFRLTRKLIHKDLEDFYDL